VHGDMTPGKGSEALSFSNRRVDHIWFRSPSGNNASVSVGGWAGGGKFKLRTSSNSGPFTPASIANLQVWWEADFADGEYGTSVTGTGTVADPYQLDKLGNRGDLEGTFDALAPTERAKWDFVNGYRSAWFDATNDSYEFSGTAADTTFLTKESTLFLVFRPRQTASGNDVILSTNDGTGITGSGLYIRWETAGRIRYLVNENSSTLRSFTTSDGDTPAGEVSIVSVHRDDTDLDIRVNGAFSVNNSHVATTLEATNPLRIGTNGSGSQNYDGDLIAVIAYDRQLDSEELNEVEQYLIGKYGNQAPELSLNLEAKFFLDPDYGISTGDNSYVRLAYDQSGYILDVAADSEAKQPELVEDGINGHRVIRFAGLGGLKSDVTPGTGPQSSHPTTVALLYKRNTNVSGAVAFDLDVNNAKISWVGGGSTASAYAGSNLNHPVAPTVGEWLMIVAKFDGAATHFDINTVRTIGDSGSREPTASSRLLLGAAENDGNADEADLAAAVVWDGKLSDVDQYTLQAHWNEKYDLGYETFSLVPGLQLWLEGDDPANTLDGYDIDAWNNRGAVGGSFDSAAGKEAKLSKLGQQDVAWAKGGDTFQAEYDGAASDFDFLTDGTGSTVIIAFRYLQNDQQYQTLLENRGGAGGGLLIRIIEASETAGSVLVGYYDDAGAVNAQIVFSLQEAGVLHILTVRSETNKAEIAPYDFTTRLNGVAGISRTWSGTPDGGADALRLGYSSTAGRSWNGNIFSVLAYDRYLEDSECDLVEGILRAKYETDLPVFAQLPGLVLDLDSADAVDQGDGTATSLLNRGGTVPEAVESPAGTDRPLIGSDSVGAYLGDGRLELDDLELGPGQWTAYVVIDSDDATSDAQYVFDSEDTGSGDRLAVIAVYNPAGQDTPALLSNGTDSGSMTPAAGPADAITGDQLLTWKGNDGAGAIYRNALALESGGTTGNPRIAGGRVAYGGNNNAVGGNVVSGKKYRFLLYHGSHTGDQIWTVHKALRDAYPDAPTFGSLPDDELYPGHIASKFGSAVAVWEMDDPAVELNSGNVSKVPNRLVPGTYDLTQSTALDQPLFEATGWDGAPSMLFDGSSDFMESAVGAVLGGIDTPWTIIAAVQIVSAASNQTFWSLNSSVSYTPYERFLTASTSALRTIKRDDVSLLDSETYIHNYTTARSTLATTTTGTDYKLYVNGSLDSGGAVDVGDMTVDIFAVGARRSITTLEPANIRIGAIWVYDEELDATAIADAHAAMTRRWAV